MRGSDRRFEGRKVVLLGIAVAMLALVAGMAAFSLRRQHALDATPGGSAPAGEAVAVVVKSDPAEADVVRDGKPLGSTPVIVRLAAGAAPISITVKKEGFRDAEKQIDGAGPTEVTVTLVALPTVEEPVAPTAAKAAAPPTKKDRPAGKEILAPNF